MSRHAVPRPRRWFSLLAGSGTAVTGLLGLVFGTLGGLGRKELIALADGYPRGGEPVAVRVARRVSE